MASATMSVWVSTYSLMNEEEVVSDARYGWGRVDPPLLPPLRLCILWRVLGMLTPRVGEFLSEYGSEGGLARDVEWMMRLQRRL